MNENMVNELMETEVDGFELSESNGRGDLVVLGIGIVVGALLTQVPKGYRWFKNKIQAIKDSKKDPDNVVDGEFKTVDDEFEEVANS